jgi:hypothetical protein
MKKNFIKTAEVSPKPRFVLLQNLESGFEDIYGDPSLLLISKMWGRCWMHDLTNRKETPSFSPAGPHIRSGLLDPTSFHHLNRNLLCITCDTVSLETLPLTRNLQNCE